MSRKHILNSFILQNKLHQCIEHTLSYKGAILQTDLYLTGQLQRFRKCVEERFGKVMQQRVVALFWGPVL